MTNKPLEKLKARRLFVHQFYTASATAKTVGVTEKTIGKWIKAENWKQSQENAANKELGNNNSFPPGQLLIIEDLKAYIEENAPILAKKFIPLVNNYLTLISK